MPTDGQMPQPPAGGMDESTGEQLKDDGEVSQGMGGGPMGGQRP
ncbi:hypothetical protein ACL1HZ_05920 [Corynebacterium striatum]|nr:hypothetical protein [Corynebacterium striatum]CQD03513.1 hypothetical protein U2A404210084 [Corynebacterium striatum]VFB05607.1 Uncharacterised protein [Corynebacterium striatum]